MIAAGICRSTDAADAVRLSRAFIKQMVSITGIDRIDNEVPHCVTRRSTRALVATRTLQEHWG
jgi:hypothetical protein